MLLNMSNASGYPFLIHFIISVPDATSYDKSRTIMDLIFRIVLEGKTESLFSQKILLLLSYDVASGSEITL